MPRIKHTPRKVESAVGEGGYAPAPPALFATVAATAVGPRIARVALQSPALGSSEGLDESVAAARGELVPPQQHMLSTPSCRAIIQPNRIPCVDPRCGLTFTRFRNMKRHAAQFHKLRADGSPTTEVEHETAVLAAAERTSWARVGHAERQDRPQISERQEWRELSNSNSSGRSQCSMTHRTFRINYHVAPGWRHSIERSDVGNQRVRLIPDSG